MNIKKLIIGCFTLVLLLPVVITWTITINFLPGYIEKQTYYSLLLSFTGMMIIIAIVLIVILNRKIAIPLENLVKETREINKGNYSALIKHRGIAELDSLADNFSKMVKDIHGRDIQISDSENKFRMLVEQSMVGIFIAIDNKFIYVNPGMEKIFGYTCDEMMEHNPIGEINMASCEYKPDGDMVQSCTFDGNDAVRYLLFTKRKDGESIDIEVISRRSELYGNQAYVGMVIDVTEKRRFEEKQSRLLEQLESANHELKDFAYIVSHDLKTPLHSIASLSSWIMEDYYDKFDDEGREQINLLVTMVKRMHSLIDGVLQYSRVGRVMEEKTPVDLNKLVNEVVMFISPPKNILIEVENTLPTVSYERTRIQQVFQNLIGNAVKFIDKPEGIIRISSSSEEDSFVIKISDNGPGIDEKYFEKVFQIFQTLKSKDSYESTGIGLSIVKKIVELYGGRIWIESEVGFGCTFNFTILKNENGGMKK